MQVVRAQLRGGGPVRGFLAPGAVEELLENAAAYRREQFSVVLTVTSLIDALGGGTPVLRQFREREMT